MRAWHSSLVLIAVACGGSTDVIDGGDDSGNGNDVVVQNDGGNGNDVVTSDVIVPDDAPTTETGPGPDSGPFDPSQLGTDLVLWLDAAKGITKDVNNNNNVMTWADQTTYHNDAAGSAGQNVHEPSVNATALNNLPALIFSNANQGSQYLQIADSVSLEFGTGDFAIFMVAEYANQPNTQQSQGTFYYKVAGNTTPRGPQLYGNAFVNNAYVTSVRARIDQNDNVNSAATGLNDSKFHRIGIRRSGTTLEIWADGVSTSLTPDAGGNLDVSAGGSDVFIGAQVTNFAAVRLQGGIAEVIGVKGALASTDVTNLDGYFKTKYAL